MERSARRRRRAWIARHGGRLAAALVLGLLAALPAHADICGDCPEPTEGQVRDAYPALSLADRYSWLHGKNRDYLEYDGGACTYTPSDPSVVLRNWRLETLMSGMAENCPHCVSTTTITLVVEASKSTSWSLTASASASAQLLGAGVAAEIAGTLEKTTGLKRVTSITQTFQAGWCHVIAWSIMLERAEPVASVDVSVKRQFAWWTKNKSTGGTVHQSGTVTVPCGSAALEFSCQMPLAFHVHRAQTACPDPDCQATVVTRDLGFQPPLPPGLEPPDDWEPPYPIPDEAPDEGPADPDAPKDGTGTAEAPDDEAPPAGGADETTDGDAPASGDIEE